MTRDVATVRPETTLLETVRLMAARQISGVPVLDRSGAIVGMVSEGDLVRWHEGYSERQARWLDMLAEGSDLAPGFLEGIRAQNHTAGKIMSKDVVTVEENTLAREVASLMEAHSIKRVPVVRDGRLVGIIARSDLIRALAQKLGEATPSPSR